MVAHGMAVQISLSHRPSSSCTPIIQTLHRPNLRRSLPSVALRVREGARTYFMPDPHGTGPYADEYDISTLYFDTRQLDVFHRRGSHGRAKYRVRRYGDAGVIFLERKLRKPGILIKRRTVGPMDALQLLTASDSVHGWYGEWFHRRLLIRRLRPMCQISYHRVARTLDSAECADSKFLQETTC